MSRFRMIGHCAAVMLALALACPSVQAAYVQLNSGLTNYTGALHTASGSIAVNYTAFAKGGAGDNWTTSLLNGGTANVLGGSLTGTESYVFFYQLHSNLGAGDALTKFAASGFFSSMGYIDSRAFKDLSLSGVQHIVPSYLSTPPSTVQPEIALGSGKAVTISTPIGLSYFGEPVLKNPISGAGSYLDSTLHLANFELNIAQTNYTPVLFATSNVTSLQLDWNTYGSVKYGASTISLASLNNSGGAGIAGTSTPEPGTMILSALGMSAFGGLGWLRRRRQKADEKKA